ncbi:MAG: hypothetical protein JWN94_1287 [Betaproteobacteria bacterium]|nr:hypothetical protein [Betaproteobacteria bacterium]
MLIAAGASAQQISLNIDRIDAPLFTATKITGTLLPGTTSKLELRAAEVAIAGETWRNVRLTCPELRQGRDEFICEQATLETPVKIAVTFRYSTLTKNLDLALRPAANEEWRVHITGTPGGRTLALDVRNGALTHFKAWWPATWPKPNAGTISGRATFNVEREVSVQGELALINFGFADDSGLHAAEKINTVLTLDARQNGAQWRWQSQLDWKNGDVFWDPLFVSGYGHTLTLGGTFDSRHVAIEQGRLALAGIANVDITASIDRASGKVAAASVKGDNVDIAGLYEKLLKPALQGTVLADLRCDGHADFAFVLKDSAMVSADAAFRRVSIEDNGRRFALFGLDGVFPWHREETKTAKLRIAGGEALRVPFGAFDLPLETRGLRVRMRDIEVPVLDGKLAISDFATSGERESWRWRFTGALKPISVEQLTTALGLPAMHGTLSATIPTVRYAQSTLNVDGALLFKLFDGAITIENLALENPLSKIPRLTGDVTMRNLDLDLVTQTFSFGKISGRIDADVKAMELVNWGPVRFNARIASSPGDYPRRISQAAVQNITALGGAGAAAAIQRSFLRFFETFGYSALGWSCRLELDVCHMGGIENVPQGYVIVKGGGIPAISVLGYNRNVGWRELLARLKRITEGNVIVK